MPCDESAVYIGSPEPVALSSLIAAGSRRSAHNNKICGRSATSQSQHVGAAAAAGPARNHYGTVAMAPRPLHSAATTATTFSTSRSTSSSSSTASSTGSPSCSPSSFDHAVRNDSTNSSSSLILILERPAIDVTAEQQQQPQQQQQQQPATRVVAAGASKSQPPSTGRSAADVERDNRDRADDCGGSGVVIVAGDQRSAEAPSPSSGLGVRSVASSLETLARKKAGARCTRRRRSTTSPRSARQQQRSRSRDDVDDGKFRAGDAGQSAAPIDDDDNDDDDGFVATSTLTKNRDGSSGVLSVLTNSSRSAGKVRLQSSASTDSLARAHALRGGCSYDRDIALGSVSDIGVASYTPTAIKSQQSTISVAAIRGTNNMTTLDTSPGNNNNNNNNNNYSSNNNNKYPTMGGSAPSNSEIRVDKVAGNFAVRVRCNVPSASAPALHRYHHHQQQQQQQPQPQQQPHQMPGLTRAFSSHSTTTTTSSAPHSLAPLASVESISPLLLGSSLPTAARRDVKTTATPSTITTTSASARAGPVKPVAAAAATAASMGSSIVGTSAVFPTGKSASRVSVETTTTTTSPEAAAEFARVDSSTSLKSSSFTTGKIMKINRARTSLHASLGQLPISSSCGSGVVGCVVADAAASLEHADTIATTFTGHESNAASSMPITRYSSLSPVDATTLSPYATTRTSLERVCCTTGASTMSSASSKTPMIALTATSVNVASTFRNNLAPTGSSNSSAGNNNNGRCNHLSGTCTGACSATTITTSQTSSTLTRTPNLANGVASTSSWTNNSAEQETDYVVDPVQGNAYHKGQFLGKGGFARVYLMTDVANGNQYACKIIPKNRMQKIHIQKIAREIMIHKELNHVNVVQMHHYFEDNINVYMLLEPCPRKSLMHVLKYRGKVTEPEARYYMKQMVTGVAYIHSQKVVHRDLKPGNMFLSDGMIVKIGDFGLATRPDGQRRRVTICGTPNYIAPEVLYKQAYSYEADVWALGCILYALLAGQPPFDTATLKETYARICNNRYKKLDDTVVSRSGQDLIRWLLQPTPELRPSLERVKEHAYLTMEYVPTKLAHTCCYRMPPPHALAPEQGQSSLPQQLGLSSTSVISRALVSTENIEKNKRDLAAGAIMQKSLHQITSGTISQTQLEALKIGAQKKPKVGNWLFRKLPKLPRFRQRLSRLLCPEQKKPDSAMMHRALEACLAEIRCTRAQENPMLVDRIAPLFVTKWIDYSNKYGLGFQLSDRSVGVLFNDSTKMSYTHDRRRVEYATTDDDVTSYRRELDVPPSMEEKLELLRHFTHYMDNFLTNGGEVKEQRPTKLSRTNSASVPRMRRWLRTDKAIVMELTVPLLQVNFFVDHSKIVVSEGVRGRGYLVTYIDASRQASSYWLNDLRDVGCTAELYERLHYVCKVIAELEKEAIFDPPSAVTHQQHRKPFRT